MSEYYTATHTCDLCGEEGANVRWRQNPTFGRTGMAEFYLSMKSHDINPANDSKTIWSDEVEATLCQRCYKLLARVLRR